MTQPNRVRIVINFFFKKNNINAPQKTAFLALRRNLGAILSKFAQKVPQKAEKIFPENAAKSFVNAPKSRRTRKGYFH